jgi:hypothetical protein
VNATKKKSLASSVKGTVRAISGPSAAHSHDLLLVNEPRRAGVAEASDDDDDDDERDAHKDQRDAVIPAERRGKTLDQEFLRCGRRGYVDDGPDEDVEFLDDEAEGDDRETGASLGEKGALVGSVIGEVTDHGR